MRKPIIAGNWKMNLSHIEALQLVGEIYEGIGREALPEIVVAPPFTSLFTLSEYLKDKTSIKLAAQNMHWENSGAFTGEISPQMLKALNVEYAIVGHSERRHIMGENNDQISAKVETALNNNLVPILCVGETLEERNKSLTEKIIKEQIDAVFTKRLSNPEKIVIAYEPVWAIGTGINAEPEDANAVAALIRNILNEHVSGVADIIRIQYGGSVTDENVDDIMSMPEIDGVLVGGASLKADKFLRIIKYKKKTGRGL